MSDRLVTVDRAATFLGVPTGFYRLLAQHGCAPKWDHDDLVSLSMLAVMRRERPWLNMLASRLTRAEVMRLDKRLKYPSDHQTLIAGETYVPLWRILEYTWTNR